MLGILAALGGGIAVFLGYMLVQVLLLHRWPDNLRSALVLGQLGAMLPMTLVVLALARLLRVLPDAAPRLPVRPGLAAAVATWTSLAALLTMGVVTWILALLAPALLVRLQSHGIEMYAPLFRVEAPGDVLLILLTVTLVPAICEELLFRGFVQRVLAGALPAAWAIGITSILFAGIHLEAVGFLSRIILSVALGIAYHRTGSLRLPVMMHGVYNLVVVLLFPWEMEPIEAPSPATALVGLAVSLPLGGLVAFLWWRAMRALPRRLA